jgi:hypothetical protein
VMKRRELELVSSWLGGLRRPGRTKYVMKRRELELVSSWMTRRKSNSLGWKPFQAP